MASAPAVNKKILKRIKAIEATQSQILEELVDLRGALLHVDAPPDPSLPKMEKTDGKDKD